MALGCPLRVLSMTLKKASGTVTLCFLPMVRCFLPVKDRTAYDV